MFCSTNWIFCTFVVSDQPYLTFGRVAVCLSTSHLIHAPFHFFLIHLRSRTVSTYHLHLLDTKHCTFSAHWLFFFFITSVLHCSSLLPFFGDLQWVLVKRNLKFLWMNLASLWDLFFTWFFCLRFELILQESLFCFWLFCLLFDNDILFRPALHLHDLGVSVPTNDFFEWLSLFSMLSPSGRFCSRFYSSFFLGYEFVIDFWCLFLENVVSFVGDSLDCLMWLLRRL